MRKYLRIYRNVSLITFGGYLVAWLCAMFIHLEYIHPFYLFLQIPVEDVGYRVNILFGFACIEAVKHVITYDKWK